MVVHTVKCEEHGESSESESESESEPEAEGQEHFFGDYTISRIPGLGSHLGMEMVNTFGTLSFELALNNFLLKECPSARRHELGPLLSYQYPVYKQFGQILPSLCSIKNNTFSDRIQAIPSGLSVHGKYDTVIFVDGPLIAETIGVKATATKPPSTSILDSALGTLSLTITPNRPGPIRLTINVALAIDSSVNSTRVPVTLHLQHLEDTMVGQEGERAIDESVTKMDSQADQLLFGNPSVLLGNMTVQREDGGVVIDESVTESDSEATQPIVEDQRPALILQNEEELMDGFEERECEQSKANATMGESDEEEGSQRVDVSSSPVRKVVDVIDVEASLLNQNTFKSPRSTKRWLSTTSQQAEGLKQKQRRMLPTDFTPK
ncbi:hypothetical protein JAAARDRAFT_197591 [Jaapia argillacea MUCL 33604]|uniref:Uncharacterized protein n=1 Tax=Jaapia argillacea MUCL 33604 TaxID=933084 RepID=A0A067PDV7_9AGAM|nr:hypothetical protein JAAARDRAFT_197591 [Jaapia argillacea MUCL 33604]